MITIEITDMLQVRKNYHLQTIEDLKMESKKTYKDKARKDLLKEMIKSYEIKVRELEVIIELISFYH